MERFPKFDSRRAPEIPSDAVGEIEAAAGGVEDLGGGGSDVEIGDLMREIGLGGQEGGAQEAPVGGDSLEARVEDLSEKKKISLMNIFRSKRMKSVVMGGIALAILFLNVSSALGGQKGSLQIGELTEGEKTMLVNMFYENPDLTNEEALERIERIRNSLGNFSEHDEGMEELESEPNKSAFEKMEAETRNYSRIEVQRLGLEKIEDLKRELMELREEYDKSKEEKNKLLRRGTRAEINSYLEDVHYPIMEEYNQIARTVLVEAEDIYPDDPEMIKEYYKWGLLKHKGVAPGLHPDDVY